MRNPLSYISAHTQTAVGVPTHAVTIIVGEQVSILLAQANFSMDWDILYQQCPWATPFQSRNFVATWYDLFKEKYMPLVLVQKQGDKLIGLMTLALSASGKILFAGTNIAEYQVWLAYPDNSDNFIKQALQALARAYPGIPVHLKYIPANTPLEWVAKDSFFSSRCLVKTHKQPLMRINYTRLAKELQKKNRKEKVNRLKRLGNLQFIKITEAAEFDSLLDDLVLQSDFRKGAMFDWCPFQQSPTKKKFMSALFRRGLVHVSVLKLDDKIIASNAGIYGKKWVYLQGINTHCPMHARYSPGILHFLMLGLMLADEGIEVFDLTPGGDDYKDTLATDYTEAHELTFLSPTKTMLKKTRSGIDQFLKQQALKIGLSLYDLRSLKKQNSIKKQKLKLAKHVKLNGALFQQLKRSFSNATPTLREVEKLIQVETQPIPLRSNELADLIKYCPKGTLQTKWEFLENAMKRLEARQVCYTWADENRLLACVWVAIPHKSRNLSIDSALVPEGAHVLEDVYIHPSVSTQTDNIMQHVVSEIEGSTYLLGMRAL